MTYTVYTSHFDFHVLYKHIKRVVSLVLFRDTKDLQKRVDILHSSKFDKLNPKQKEVIVRNPVAGQVSVNVRSLQVSVKLNGYH